MPDLVTMIPTPSATPYSLARSCQDLDLLNASTEGIALIAGIVGTLWLTGAYAIENHVAWASWLR